MDSLWSVTSTSVKEGATGDRGCILDSKTSCDSVALRGVDVRGALIEANELVVSKSSWKLLMSSMNEVDTKLFLERVLTFYSMCNYTHTTVIEWCHIARLYLNMCTVHCSWYQLCHSLRQESYCYPNWSNDFVTTFLEEHMYIFCNLLNTWMF